MQETVIEVVDPSSADLAYLIGKLDEELLTRYPAEGIFGLDFEDPQIADIRFIVAYAGEQPVGCGAIRALDRQSVELKRFYVDGAYRGKGVAQQLLLFLETEARERQFTCMKLEAGPNQPDALRFYEKNGFLPIDKYGEYVDCEYSLCYEKLL